MASQELHDSAGAAQVLLRHRAMLSAFIYSIVRDVGKTEDLLQELAVVLIRNWQKFLAVQDQGAYLREIARRLVLSEHRKSLRRPRLLPADVLDGMEKVFASAAEPSQLAARHEALEHCLDQLDPRHRQLVEMRYLQDRSYPEISAVWGGTVNSIRIALCRIRKTLARCADRQLGAVAEPSP